MRERPSTRRVKAEPVELGYWLDVEGIRAAVPVAALDRVLAEPQKAFPAIAKDEAACRQIERAITTLKSGHVLHNADSRELDLKPESVDLVVTSPPYWTLKRYNEHDAQLGHVQDYEEFLDELDEVWRRCFDALVPGGRLVIVVGDVNVSRKAFGRHMVYPLHASIQERCRLLRYDNLAPIFWYKIANGQYEMGPGGFYGKPYEPNGVIKNDVEYILFQRKPGGYRKPDVEKRILSIIPAAVQAEWFQQVWRLGGASTRSHPAPFPVALAGRLIRMFSFVGDTVFDPFLGTGTTSLAALRTGRNSIGSEVDPAYFVGSVKRLRGAVGLGVQSKLDLTA